MNMSNNLEENHFFPYNTEIKVHFSEMSFVENTFCVLEKSAVLLFLKLPSLAVKNILPAVILHKGIINDVLMQVCIYKIFHYCLAKKIADVL